MAQTSSGTQLQRSAVSFRRQGSSGVVWDDRYLSGELARPESNRTEPLFFSGEIARPNRRRHRERAHVDVNLRPIRAVRSNNATVPSEPPSPRLSGCGCCGALGKSPRSGGNVRPAKPRSR